MLMRWTAFDANDIPRVFAEHENPDVAETMCREDVVKYIRRRPDTGPLSEWSFSHRYVRE